jgi:hypothetical protein
MTAFVYDPLINDRGFFYKDSSGIKKASGYYVYGNKSELMSPPELNIEMPKPLENKPDSPMKNIIIIGLLAVNFLFCILLLLKINSNEKELSRLGNIKDQLNEVKGDNLKLNQKLISIAETIEAGNISSMETMKYTIKEGEDLRGIVKAVMQDESKVNLVVKLNKLKNEFDIKPGQIIELPLN